MQTNGAVDGFSRSPRASFHVRTESRLEGHLFDSQRQMRPNGATDGFSRSMRTSFHVQNENRSEGRLFGFWRQMSSICSGGQEVRPDPSVILVRRSEANSGARPLPLDRNHLYSPVTRIQSPIKEKP